MKDSQKTWLMRIAVNTCRDYQRTGWFRHTDRRVTQYDLWCIGDEPYADDNFFDEHRVLIWGGQYPYSSDWDGTTLQEWEEYVFPVNEELLEKTGSIPVSIHKTLGLVNANIKVRIPLRLVRNEK